MRMKQQNILSPSSLIGDFVHSALATGNKSDISVLKAFLQLESHTSIQHFFQVHLEVLAPDQLHWYNTLLHCSLLMPALCKDCEEFLSALVWPCDADSQKQVVARKYHSFYLFLFSIPFYCFHHKIDYLKLFQRLEKKKENPTTFMVYLEIFLLKLYPWSDMELLKYVVIKNDFEKVSRSVLGRSLKTGLLILAQASSVCQQLCLLLAWRP